MIERPCESLEALIASRITIDGRAALSPRVAKWLEKRANITEDQRSRLFDTDVDAWADLMGLHLAGQQRSPSGTKTVDTEDYQTESEAWMLNTTQVARELHVTVRCVRSWCSTGKLPATKVGRDWQIRRADLHIHTLSA